MIYVPSKGLRIFGILVLLTGLVGQGYIICFPNSPGTEVAYANNTLPVPQVGLVTQFAVAQGQKMVQDAMRNNGMPIVATDQLRQIDVAFNPIHVPANLGEATLILAIKSGGFNEPTNSSHRHRIGSEYYELQDAKTGAIVWQKQQDQRVSGANADGSYGLIGHNTSEKSISYRRGMYYHKIGRVKDLPEGDYILKGNLTVLQYSYPIKQIDLSLNIGVDEDPKIYFMFGFAAAIFAGFFLFFITVPPEKRVKREPVSKR